MESLCENPSDNNMKLITTICWAQTICPDLYTLLGHIVLTATLWGWCFFLVYILQMGALSLGGQKACPERANKWWRWASISPSIRPSLSCLPSGETRKNIAPSWHTAGTSLVLDYLSSKITKLRSILSAILNNHGALEDYRGRYEVKYSPWRWRCVSWC